MQERSNRFLAQEPVGKLMGMYAIPCIISLLVAALYNIVDQIFIANATYLGSYGNAANTVVFPLTVIALAIAVLIGDGCCAFVSICLGSGDPESAHRSIGNAIVLCVAASVVLTALYLIFQQPLLTVFGGQINEETFRLSREYFFFLPLDICSLLSQISLVAAMAAINNMIRTYGALDPIFGQAEYAQIPMAVVGIVMKFFQIVISIAVGLAAGCIPIVGYNIGADLKARARRLFTLLLSAEAAVGAVALLIVEVFPRPLIFLFGAADESVYYTDFAVHSFRIYLCMMILACVNKGAFIYLQALGKALESTLLSTVREVVFGVGFALLLPVFFRLDGVLYSMPVSDVLTFVLTVFLIRSTYKKLCT